ncbi:MAG: hypothetical protein NC401_14230, partial [Ruminococcus sp.]|nr:hypothetical protein [Ruminococcus sp.]
TFAEGVDRYMNASETKGLPRFVELDGHLYGVDATRTDVIDIDCGTAKVVSRTDDTIEFRYLEEYYGCEPHPTEYENEPLYSEFAFGGVLKYERDGWKLDLWGRG